MVITFSGNCQISLDTLISTDLLNEVNEPRFYSTSFIEEHNQQITIGLQYAVQGAHDDMFLEVINLDKTGAILKSKKINNANGGFKRFTDFYSNDSLSVTCGVKINFSNDNFRYAFLNSIHNDSIYQKVFYSTDSNSAALQTHFDGTYIYCVVGEKNIGNHFLDDEFYSNFWIYKFDLYLEVIDSTNVFNDPGYRINYLGSSLDSLLEMRLYTHHNDSNHYEIVNYDLTLNYTSSSKYQTICNGKEILWDNTIDLYKSGVKNYELFVAGSPEYEFYFGNLVDTSIINRCISGSSSTIKRFVSVVQENKYLALFSTGYDTISSNMDDEFTLTLLNKKTGNHFDNQIQFPNNLVNINTDFNDLSEPLLLNVGGQPHISYFTETSAGIQLNLVDTNLKLIFSQVRDNYTIPVSTASLKANSFNLITHSGNEFKFYQIAYALPLFQSNGNVEQLSYYPNPATSSITFEKPVQNIRLYCLQGKRVFDYMGETQDLELILDPGIYIIKYEFLGQNYTSRLAVTNPK